MNILYLSAQLPEPPHAGGALRVNGLLRGVHAAGHRVHLMAFATPDQNAAARAALARYCTRVIALPPPARTLTARLRDLLLTRRADMQRRFYSDAFATRLADLLQAETFDVIQFESLEMTAYLPLVAQHQPDTPLIYDSFNAEYDLQRSIFAAEWRGGRWSFKRLAAAGYSLVQWRRLVAYERDVLRRVAHTVAVSEADAVAFRRLAPGCPVTVVPNGINVADYATCDAPHDLGPAALVLTGSMNYRPNIDAATWFAHDVWPLVHAAEPDTRFVIVGSDPHPRVAALAAQDGITVTGRVPDVLPYLHGATVFVVPLRMGSGTRLKLLQALAAQRAVVTTSLGAQGVDVQDGVHLRRADTATEFAAAAIDLLRDPARRQQLGRTGANYVRARFDWPVLVPRLLAIYAALSPDTNQ